MTCRTPIHELSHDQQKTTKELLDITTRYTSSEEAVGVTFILGNAKIVASNSRAAPSKAAIKSARKGTKGGRKGQKWHPQRVIMAASDDGDDEKADDSGKEYVTTIEHKFKRQTQQQMNHFGKLLKVTCPNHS
jgi:hypothetical protein